MDDHSPFADPGLVRVRGGENRITGIMVFRRSSVPVTALDHFLPADWEASSFGLFAEGGDPPPCPECGRTGFYGPRFVEPDIRCRSCRFCGFWQRTGGAPERYLPTVHDCADWPHVSKAEYLWWVAPDLDSYTCPFCSGQVEVPVSIVSAPIDDESHPWWRVPQGKNQAVYQRLWSNWAFSAGRTIL